MPNLTGHCLCGNVTYMVDAEPLVTAICHCNSCQRQTGSTYSLVVAVPRDSVTLSGDTLATFDTITEATGTPSHRRFCSNCGSPLVTLADAAPDMAFIKAGTRFTLLEFSNGGAIDAPGNVGVIRIGGQDGFSDSAGLAGVRYDAEPGTAYLLRPDGYVAARFRHPTRATLDAALARASGQN